MLTNTLCSEHIVVKSQLGGTHPHDPMRHVQFSCAIKRVLPFLNNVRESRNLLAIWRLGQELQRKNTLRQRHTSSHVLTRQEINKTYETQIALMQKSHPTWRCGHHTATTLFLSQFGGPLVACPKAGLTQCTWATTAVVSLPPEFTRVARINCRSWRVDRPLQCCPNFNNDTHRFPYSSIRKTTNIQTKNRWTRHQNVLHTKHCRDNIVTAVVRKQLGGIHPRPPTKKLRDSCEDNASRSLPK